MTDLRAFPPPLDPADRLERSAVPADIAERYELAVGGSGIGIYDWNPQTGELFWSPQFYRIIGADPSRRASLDELNRRTHPDDRAAAAAAIRDMKDRFDFDHRVVHDDGAIRWVRVRGTVLRDGHGNLLRASGVLADITPEVQAREFRREIWAVLADPELPMSRKIQDVLEMACRRLRLTRAGIVRVDGDRCEFLYQVYPDGEQPLPRHSRRAETIAAAICEENDLCAIHDMEAGPFADMPAHRVTGVQAYIGSPLVVMGRVFGAIWIAGTEKRGPFTAWEESIVVLLAQAVGRELGRFSHMQALKDSEQRFLLAARAAKVGITEWATDNLEEQYWSDNFYRMLGYEPGEIPSRMSVFAQHIHPEDGGGGKAAMDEYIATGVPVQLEFRLRHKTLGYRWFQATAAAGTDSEGRVRMVGALMDVHDLKMAQERAEAANVAKSQFLATMSHEIRTPLNGILGMASALSRTGLNDSQQSMLGVVKESGSALLQVINQILDLSKIESGKFALDCETFVLEDLVGALGAMHELKAQEKGLRFRVEVTPEARGAYQGDPGRLRQILNNLMSNAVKFTDRGFVSLIVAADGDAAPGSAALRFDVRDTGPGMTEEERDRLFTPFTQLDSSSTRRHEGTGLGLAISRRLAEMMDGEIAVQSARGDGSLFTLRLALPRAAAPERLAPVEKENVVPLFGGRNPVRILSVDDHPTNRMVLEALLQPTGAAVTSVDSGRKALEAMQAESLAGRAFDIVLMDIQMPDMDGPATLAELRRRERAAGRAPVPVIAVTANALTHQIEEYLGQGFDGHVAKPIVMEALTRVVADAAHRRGDVILTRAAGEGDRA